MLNIRSANRCDCLNLFRVAIFDCDAKVAFPYPKIELYELLRYTYSRASIQSLKLKRYARPTPFYTTAGLKQVSR